MPSQRLLTVTEVADEFQVTTQTIRNWIEAGALPAAKIGRSYRVEREDVDSMLARAQADSASLATRRDLWAPETLGLPQRRREEDRRPGLWERASDASLPIKRQ